ncbi:MAG: hypothetical protein LBD11_05965 [Candidatus Peribacteria bacterium]|nr:hypothetical protein [Candidatus Peribacteria bacterium]
MSCNVGYTKNGNTCQVNSYTLTVNPGGSTYSQNYNTTKSVTAPAGTSYTVSYNVNGGTSTVPSSSTSTKPFSSWSLTSGT